MIYYPRRCDGSFIHGLLKPLQMVHPTALIDSFLDRTTKEANHYRGALGKYSLLETDWIKELEERGYDKTTLKFEISIKTSELFSKFSHLWDELTEAEKEALKKEGIFPPEV